MGKRILTIGPSYRWKSTCKRYTVIISKPCILKMSEIAQEHYPNEVGSSLVGAYSHDGFQAYVLEVAPLSSDSKGTPTSFYRGTAGLRGFYKKLRRGFFGRRYYVGEWHSHPDGTPFPSDTDNATQLNIAQDVNTACRECILVVIGGILSSFDQIGVFVYSRERGRVNLHRGRNPETPLAT